MGLTQKYAQIPLRALSTDGIDSDWTAQEIRDLLESRGIRAGRVTLTAPSGAGPGPNWARVEVRDADVDFWERWPASSSSSSAAAAAAAAAAATKSATPAPSIRGHKVTIGPSPTENLLCVARLPRDLHRDDFRRLVGLHGDVKFSFLLCSEKTGASITTPPPKHPNPKLDPT